MAGKNEVIKNSNINEKVKMEKVLIENFVSLQRVMTNLAVKFDTLSNQISKLLELFEISAKTLAERGPGEDRKAVEKLDSLLEQNKIIAKGIALLHERGNPEQQEEIQPVQTIQKIAPPAYPARQPQQQGNRIIEREEYPRQPQTEFSKNPQPKRMGL